jgi:murein DD-endopeptidase MepM/ murein hydrolase activator NlpD
VSRRTPLDRSPNYVGFDIDRDSVEDADVSYEYIKEAVFDQYRVDYLPSPINVEGTILYEQPRTENSWLASLFSFGSNAGKSFYVAVDGFDDFKTLPCNLNNAPENQENFDRGLLEQFSIFKAPPDMTDLSPGDRVLVDYALGVNDTRQNYGYITQKLSGKMPLPQTQEQCDRLQGLVGDREQYPLPDLRDPEDTDVSGEADPANGPAQVIDNEYRAPFGPLNSDIFREPDVRVSSEFGPRTPPATAGGGRGSSNHPGLDVACPVGTPIYAVADAKVTYSAPQPGGGGAGEYIALTWEVEGASYRALYFHLRANNGRLVYYGDDVRAGQHIGYTGNTGNSSGPHLHFEIEIDRTEVNPRDYVPHEAFPAVRRTAMV